MLPLAALFATGLSFAAEPPRFPTDQDVGALRADAQAVIQAVNVVLPQPVQPDRVAIIKGGLDDVARQSGAADSDAKSLQARVEPPLLWMTALVKGKGDIVGCERRVPLASGSISAARRRHQEAMSLADSLKSELNRPEREKDPDKPRKLAEIAQAAAKLNAADGPLREAEDAVSKFESPCSEMKSKLFNANELKFELDKNASELARHAAIAQNASGEAKAAVDNFKEGDNASQARAYGKITETLDAGKNASNYAGVCATRVAWIGERYASSLKAQAKLVDVLSGFTKKLDEAEAPLASAEQILANLRR